MKKFEMAYEQYRGAKACRRQRVTNWNRRRLQRQGLLRRDFTMSHKKVWNEGPANGYGGK